MRLLGFMLLACIITACTEGSGDDFRAEGRKLVQEGNQHGAVVFFRNALEKDPNDFDTRLDLARTYLQIGRQQQAEEEFQKCLRLQPDNPALQMDLARLATLKKEPAAVLDHVAKAERTAGTTAESRELAGMAYALQSSPQNPAPLEDAQKALEQALALEPKRTSALVGLARIALAKRDPATAMERTEQALAVNPNDQGALVFRAELATRMNDLPRAIACYRTLAGLSPKDEAARYMLVLLLMQQGNDEEAGRIRQGMRADFGESALVLMLDGIAAYEAGDFTRAATAFQASVAKLPSIEGQYRLGLAFTQTGNLESAVTHLRKVLDFAPSHAPALQQMCRVLMAQGRLDDAELEAKNLISSHPRNAMGYFLLGSIQSGKGNTHEAMASFERATALDPGMSEAAVRRGSLLLSEGRYQEAQEGLSAALKKDSGSIAARTALFSFHLGRKDYAAAEKVLAEGLAATPDDIRLLSLQGTLYAMQGKNTDALAVLTRVRGLDPDFVPALSLEVRLRALAGDTDTACGLYTSYLQRHPDDTQQLVAAAAVFDMAGRHDEATAYLQRARELGAREALFILARREMGAKRPEAAEKLLLAELQKSASQTSGAAAQRDDEAIRSQLVFLYLNTNKQDAALALYDALEKARPDQAAIGKFRIYSALGKYEQALEQARVLADRMPSSSIGAVCAADALEHLGRNDAAMEELQRAYRDTQESALLVAMAEHCLRRKDLGKAEAFFRTALQQTPDDLGALRGQAYIFLLRDEYDSAIAAYERALRIAPNDVGILNNLAMAYAESGRQPDRAVRMASTAFMQQPENPQVLDTLGLCLLLDQRTDEAVKLLRGAVALHPGSAELHYRFARALLQAQDTQAAAEQLKKALALGEFEESEKARELLRQIES